MTTEILFPRQLEILAKQTAFFRLGMQLALNLSDAEPDGRKAKSLARRLNDLGWTKEEDGKLIPTEQLWESLQAEPVDLLVMWEKCFDPSRPNRPTTRFFSLHTFNGRQIKYLLENAQNYKWFVVDEYALRFPEHLQEQSGFANDKSYWWDGPHSIAAVQIRWREILGSMKTGRTFPIIAVSSEALEILIAAKQREAKIENLFSINLSWALAHFGIITEEEAKMIRSSIGSLTLGIGSHAVAFHDDPSEWEQQLAKGIDHCTTLLAELQAKLALQIKIDRGIRNYGGWTKFLADYRAALVEAVDNQQVEESK